MFTSKKIISKKLAIKKMTRKKKDELRKQRRELMIANRKHFAGAMALSRCKHIERTKEGMRTMIEVVSSITISIILIILFLYIVL